MNSTRLPDGGVSAMRQAAPRIFDHALAACDIHKAFARRIECTDGRLLVGGMEYDLRECSQLALVSIGKAGHTMAEALAGIVPAKLHGIVSCPVLPTVPVPELQYFQGGHPMPNEASLQAGEAILTLLRSLPEDALAVFCISGGASAIAEWPLDERLTLADVIATSRVLVHSGAPIAEINAIRKHLSATKGGRMAAAAAPAQQVSLLVSDVPDHALDALASGPTMADSSTVDDCYDIASRYAMVEEFPAAVREQFESHALVETPKRGNAVFKRSRYETVLSNATAVEAAKEAARAMGFRVEVDNHCDDWDYVRAAEHLLARLRQLRRESERVCLISGGEVTVKVGAGAGVGGRNQQFCLYCAERIAGNLETVVSAGTDGVDGNSPAAGAVVDGTSLERARKIGLSVEKAAEGFNAFPLLDAIGDAIVTGPTGNNVRDLRILLSY